MRNTVAMGAVAAILGADLEILHELIREEFADKKPEITRENIATANAGFNYITKSDRARVTNTLARRPVDHRPMVVNGNEAIALGAIAAGLQFAAIYPMTPTSNILHILAPLQEHYHFIYEQPEDEIAAINMAIGASFAGARSMVATAGGGFCLMTEGYGLAGMTETPLVIIEGMRGGPATGLPTWTEQGDLQFVLHAHQGDFPRIVLAAADQTDAYSLTVKAFYLADKYQTAVVVMVDKYICESSASVPPFTFDEAYLDRGHIIRKKQSNYARYALSANGISPRALPGTGTYVIANSDEHNPAGYSEESSDNRIAQMDKRATKLATAAAEDMEAPVLYGPKKASLTLVSWGSTRGPILEALKQIPDVNYLHVTWMNPFPSAAVAQILRQAKQIMSIECNSTGEFTALIREKTGIQIEDTFLKYDGRPFYPEEIVEKIKNAMNIKRRLKFW
jgi:2-oxoglutarate ferredoxin oxidoreductase subunit alpha